MKYLVAAGILTAAGMAVSCSFVVLVVCRVLAHDEDAHGGQCVCPSCDPEWGDDLMDVAEAAGVVPVPLVRELAWTPAIREMPIDESATWLATARDIDDLPVIRGGR